MAGMFKKLTVLAGAAEAARRYAKKNPQKVARIADKAGKFVDQKTHGKYHHQIQNAVRKVQRPGPGGQQPPYTH